MKTRGRCRPEKEPLGRLSEGDARRETLVKPPDTAQASYDAV